jgi:hypothetical protein
VSDIFFALLFSTLANLVYPAVSSLVSRCGLFLYRSTTRHGMIRETWESHASRRGAWAYIALFSVQSLDHKGI